tara:strand:+ start:204 stop:581 length:378 start_codon:yes stop_codon:yes gene_type:complete
MNLYLEKKERKNNIKMKNRAQKIRYKIKSVSKRNRLTVFRSNSHIYAQLIDDVKGITLASSASIQPSIKDKKLNKKEVAEFIGKEIAKKIIAKGIKDVAFDRGKYKYHGLIKILADAARNEGLNF